MRHHIVRRSLFPRYRLPARIAELRAALALAYSDPAPYRPRLIIAGFTLSQPKSNYALPALGVLAIAALLAALWFGRTHTPTTPMSEGGAETTPFHLARRALAAVATETHVYVIGGMDNEDRYVAEVEYASILPDGTLGEWREDPEHAVVDRYIHSATRLGDKLYLLGGHEQSAESVSYGDVEMAAIQTSGALSPWQIQKSVLN